MVTHIVCKPLPAADGVIPAGAEVDASTWRHVDRLVDLRYLRPIVAEQQPARDKTRGREVRHAN
jgi:hypothetical protein